LRLAGHRLLCPGPADRRTLPARRTDLDAIHLRPAPIQAGSGLAERPVLGQSRDVRQILVVNMSDRHARETNCPCGSGDSLDQCCGRYHAGTAAPSAERLMRSRYSAYVLGLIDYLQATT